MKPTGRPAVRSHRAGMSITELVVASALGAFLMTLVATTWTNLGVPALEVAARARIEQEGILAAQSLACDLGGFLTDLPAMQTGVASSYQASSPRWNTSNPGVLMLNFTGASQSDAIVITYQLAGSQLVRTNSSTSVSTTVASNVTAFSAAPYPDNTSYLEITLTIAYRDFTSTFTLIGVPPS